MRYLIIFAIQMCVVSSSVQAMSLVNALYRVRSRYDQEFKDQLGKKLISDVIFNRIAKVKRGIARGADVNYRSGGQMPLLEIRFVTNSEEDCLNMTMVLVQAGADINAFDSDGWTALIRACYLKKTSIIKFLVQSGADLNVKGIGGCTALMIAASLKYYAGFQILLNAGADMTIPNNNGTTVVDYVIGDVILQTMIVDHIDRMYPSERPQRGFRLDEQI